LACHDRELSILFTDDSHMTRLNRRYLNREGPTNVLAFPMSGGPPPNLDSEILGDVVISVDTAVKESMECDESPETTIYRLLIHGVLHLLNFDHVGSIQEARRMEKEEKRLLELIGHGP